MKILATKWVIRHNPTGNFLPEPKGRLGRGGSWLEPMPVEQADPRLFKSKRSAQRALTAWLMGKHEATIGYEYDEWSGKSYACQDGICVTPVESRKREEMEIVEVHVVLST